MPVPCLYTCVLVGTYIVFKRYYKDLNTGDTQNGQESYCAFASYNSFENLMYLKIEKRSLFSVSSSTQI